MLKSQRMCSTNKNSGFFIKFLFYLIVFILCIALLFDTLFPTKLTPTNQHFAKVITAEDGTPLRAFADSNGIWRYPISIDEVSPLYIEALINYEDRWFWHHPGVNPFAIIRALIQNMTHAKIVSGGSTLTMQVARLLSPHSRSISGKINQIFIALQLEWHYSKREILEYYLNHAPFGGTIEGVQAASYTYFGKSAKELSHAEAALLTVLPQAPSRNRPDRHPARALSARNKVLSRLSTQSVWSQKIVKQASLEPIIAQHNTSPRIAPLLARRLKANSSTSSTIKTTINLDMQMGIESMVKNYVNQLPAKTSAAVLVVENQSLKVKAYIGSADFLDSNRFGHIDMIRATRSPGSTLKPFLYGIAIDQGIVHSQSLLSDAPLSFNSYKPQNFSRGFNGPVSVSHALQRSLNIPAVQVLHHLTPELFVSTLKNAGLKLHLEKHTKSNLSIVLGGIGSNLETLVATYSAFANSGLSGKLRFLSDSSTSQRYLLSAGTAWVIKNILSHKNTTSPYALSWKTGTSYGHRDFWSIGITAKYTIGVWVGRPDGTPLPGYYGANTATPLLFSITENLPQSALLKQPDTVMKQTICWPLGYLETETEAEHCHEKKQAWIVDKSVPQTLPFHTNNHWLSNPMTIRINSQSNLVVNHSCDPSPVIDKQIALWPLAIEPWIAKRYQRQSQIGMIDSSCQSPVVLNRNELKIEGLENNTILRSAGASQKLPEIKLQAKGAQGKLYWFINAKLSYTLNNNKNILHQFKSAGKYQITLVDEAGHSDSINITIL